MEMNREAVKRLYREIDCEIDKHYNQKKNKMVCGRGCSSCCSQFFEVSELEFDVVRAYLNTLDEESRNRIDNRAQVIQEAFKDHYQDFYQKYYAPSNKVIFDEAYYARKERYEVVLPCVFLSREGFCEIYEARPLTCRTTGVGFTQWINRGAICSEIRFGLFTPFWQANLIKYAEQIESVRWIETEDGEAFKNQLPLFVWLERM